MEKFNFKTLADVQAAIDREKLPLRVAQSCSALNQPLEESGISLANRMVVLPMEGCDSDTAGRPSDLTVRRYLRFAAGGAGLVWFEAMAVVDAGRGNPGQLCINDETWQSFAELIEKMREETRKAGHPRQFVIAQLTHAGRYAKPHGTPEAITPEPNAALDAKYSPEQLHTITDEEAEQLVGYYAKAAMLAKKAGFDAVDVKMCHRYLLSDFLSAFDRPGKYGGSYENRTRLMKEIIDAIHTSAPGLPITPRVNAYDSLPRPLGWGSDEKNNPDLTEPKRFLQDLYERGVRLVNISCGNPYYNPHVGRPFDNGPYIPPMSQMQSTALMLRLIRELQRSQPDMIIVATGFTWLRQFGPHLAAAGIEDGDWKLAGFGRQSLAYPNFAQDIAEKGELDSVKCCVACSNCTQIMRDGGTTGCAVRDSALYLPILKKGRAGRPIPTPQVACDHIP